MKRMLKSVFCLSLLISSILVYAKEKTYGKSFFTHRSQGADLSRELIMTNLQRPDENDEDFFTTLSLYAKYSRSFDRDNIGTYFFFNGLNRMKFGNPIDNGGDPDVDVSAYNFGLGENFTGYVEAKPRVENVVVDFNAYIELNKWIKGLWFQFNAPLTWSRWQAHLYEEIVRPGDPFLSGQMSNWLFGNQAPLVNNSIVEAWKGKNLFGDMVSPWEYGKINDNKKHNKMRFADLKLILGYRIWEGTNGYLGINLRGVIPTGNKSQAEYVFEPMIGNGRHGEIGAGLDAHWKIIDNYDESLGFYCSGYVTHLFENTQKRSFDFKKNGVGSRYLLLKEFNGNNGNYEKLVNAINITTLDTGVKVSAQGELLALLSYQKGCFSADFGYNFWSRAKEKCTIKGDIEADRYAFLGIVQNFPNGAGVGYLNNPAVNSSAANNITIKGTNSAVEPIEFISVGSLDPESGASPAAYSHKIFGDVAFTWNHINTPFIGLGIELELSGKRNNALDQWGIYTKGGFSY